MLQELNGKVALVTGAASGIGHALAEALGVAGMRVVATDIDESALAGSFAESAAPPSLLAKLDIRERTAWSEMVDRAESEIGTIQLLCNIAGVTVSPTPALDLSAEAWEWVLGTNLTGAFHGVSVVAGRLRDLGLPGHVVNTASVQGLLATSDFLAYNSAKFGIVGFSETLRMELGQIGIGVSVLCPGATRTNMMGTLQTLAPQFAPAKAVRPREGFTNYQTAVEVAQKTLDAIRHNRFYIITHPEYQPILEARWKALADSIPAGADAAAIANVCSVEHEMLKNYQSITKAETGSKT